MKELLSTGDVARLTGFSIQTVIRAIDRGLLPAIRVPGSRFRRVYWDDLVVFASKEKIRLRLPLEVKEEEGSPT